jgi:hypothetical protein
LLQGQRFFCQAALSLVQRRAAAQALFPKRRVHSASLDELGMDLLELLGLLPPFLLPLPAEIIEGCDLAFGEFLAGLCLGQECGSFVLPGRFPGSEAGMPGIELAAGLGEVIALLPQNLFPGCQAALLALDLACPFLKLKGQGRQIRNRGQAILLPSLFDPHQLSELFRQINALIGQIARQPLQQLELLQVGRMDSRQS